MRTPLPPRWRIEPMLRHCSPRWTYPPDQAAHWPGANPSERAATAMSETPRAREARQAGGWHWDDWPDLR